MQLGLSLHATQEPTSQATVDIFKDEWWSQLPDGLRSGSAGLFGDPRVAWANNQLDISGKSVLELGPLEGGHTFTLHSLGADTITAIEGNSRAYLKCLVVKELFSLRSVNFLYGDFCKYLETSKTDFDLIFASGVLYHMNDPLKLLSLIAQHSNKLYLWTHYYDNALLQNVYGDQFISRFGPTVNIECMGYHCEAHTYYYPPETLESQTFCGGNAPTSLWLTRHDILSFLDHVGFNKIAIDHETPTHQYGPAFSIAATASKS
jgi:hypothetical protein